MNYRAELQALRERCDREVRRLKREHPELSSHEIGRLLGCSSTRAQYALKPERARAANAVRHRRYIPAGSESP